MQRKKTRSPVIVCVIARPERGNAGSGCWSNEAILYGGVGGASANSAMNTIPRATKMPEFGKNAEFSFRDRLQAVVIFIFSSPKL